METVFSLIFFSDFIIAEINPLQFVPAAGETLIITPDILNITEEQKERLRDYPGALHSKKFIVKKVHHSIGSSKHVVSIYLEE